MSGAVVLGALAMPWVIASCSHHAPLTWQVQRVPGPNSHLLSWRHVLTDVDDNGTIDLVEAAGGDVMAQPLFIWETPPGTQFGFGAASGARSVKGLYYATAIKAAPSAPLWANYRHPTAVLFGTILGPCQVGGDPKRSVGIWSLGSEINNFIDPHLVFPSFQVRDFTLADVDGDGTLDLIVAGTQQDWCESVAACVCPASVDAMQPLLSANAAPAVDVQQDGGSLSTNRPAVDVQQDGGSLSTNGLRRLANRLRVPVRSQPVKTDVDCGGGPASFQVSVHLNCRNKNTHCRTLPTGALPFFDPEPVWKVSAPRQYNEPMFVRARDVDGDGLLDLVVAFTGSGIYSLLGQRSAGDGKPVFGGISGVKSTLSDLEAQQPTCGTSPGAAAGCRIPITPRLVTALDLYRDDRGTHLAATLACFSGHTNDACCTDSSSGVLLTWDYGARPETRPLTRAGGFEDDTLPTALAFWPAAQPGSKARLALSTLRLDDTYSGLSYMIAEEGRGAVEAIRAADGALGGAGATAPDGGGPLPPLLGWVLDLSRAGYPSSVPMTATRKGGRVLTLPGPPIAWPTKPAPVVKWGGTPIAPCAGPTTVPCYHLSSADGTIMVAAPPEQPDLELSVSTFEPGPTVLAFSEAFFLRESGWLSRMGGAGRNP